MAISEFLHCRLPAIRMMSMMEIRVVFMGSPDFAVPTLRALAAHYPVTGVVTQPDRPAGRGQTLTPPPIKTLALELGLEVFQPERLRHPDSFARLQAWAPDLIVVAAFGQILRKNVLELPHFGCVNVHASLLPRWRGAAPIQAALLHGDPTSGATIMTMDSGIDTGGMLAQSSLAILPDYTTASLSTRLAEAGAQLLIETLPGYLAGKIQPNPQDETSACYAPMIQKEEGLLDLSQPAQDLVNRVRAFYPWPGAYLIWQGQPLKIHRAHARLDPDSSPDASPPGTHAILDRQPAVRAATGWLVFDTLQPAGKKAMSGHDFLSGARTWATN